MLKPRELSSSSKLLVDKLLQLPTILVWPVETHDLLDDITVMRAQLALEQKMVQCEDDASVSAPEALPSDELMQEIKGCDLWRHGNAQPQRFASNRLEAKWKQHTK